MSFLHTPIHRDIEPANVMLCIGSDLPDTLEVLDFGLVLRLGGSDRERPDGDSLMGTLFYTSPETVERAAPRRA